MDRPETQRWRSGSPTTPIDCIEEKGDFSARPPTCPLCELRAENERLTVALGPSAAEAWAHMYDETVRLTAEIDRLRATLGIWQRQFYELKARGGPAVTGIVTGR